MLNKAISKIFSTKQGNFKDIFQPNKAIAKIFPTKQIVISKKYVPLNNLIFKFIFHRTEQIVSSEIYSDKQNEDDDLDDDGDNNDHDEHDDDFFGKF